MGRLDGKTVVVTGASSGIGLAIARSLGSEGGNIVLNGRQRETMAAAAKEIEGAGGKALVQPGDVTATYANIDALIEAIDYHPQTPIEDGINHFVAWYLEHMYKESA